MEEKYTIKCGRQTLELKKGDTIMDNGACYQLITRTRTVGYSNISVMVSKKEFKKFISNSFVTVNKSHSYGEQVILYTYKDDPEGLKQLNKVFKEAEKLKLHISLLNDIPEWEVLFHKIDDILEYMRKINEENYKKESN